MKMDIETPNGEMTVYMDKFLETAEPRRVHKLLKLLDDDQKRDLLGYLGEQPETEKVKGSPRLGKKYNRLASTISKSRKERKGWMN